MLFSLLVLFSIILRLWSFISLGFVSSLVLHWGLVQPRYRTTISSRAWWKANLIRNRCCTTNRNKKSSAGEEEKAYQEEVDEGRAEFRFLWLSRTSLSQILFKAPSSWILRSDEGIFIRKPPKKGEEGSVTKRSQERILKYITKRNDARYEGTIRIGIIKYGTG